MFSIGRNAAFTFDRNPRSGWAGTRSLGNELIAPQTALTGTGPVTCRERLGGVLKFYHRDAA